MQVRDNNGRFLKQGLLYGIGIDDTNYIKEKRKYLPNGKSKVIWFCPAFSCWKNMLKRVGKSSYNNVSVCDEWKLFSNFKTWYDLNHIDGFEMDKDILGGHTYSPETCLFIPRKLNISIVGVRLENTGVWYDCKRKNYQSYITIDGKRKHLGRYELFEDAKLMYINHKIDFIYEIIKHGQYSEQINNGLQILIRDLNDSKIKYMR